MLTVIASLLLTSCPLPDICGPRVYDITLFPRINGEPVFAYTVPQGAESISYPQITIENISDRLSVNSDTLIPVLSDYTDPFIDIWAFDKDGKLDLKKELSGLSKLRDMSRQFQ